jgi:IS30 family transposase
MQIKIRRAGTRVKFSETQIQEIEELASDMPIDKVAEQFGREEETFCNILKRQKLALRAYKKGRTVGAIRAAEKLQERMKAGSTDATIFFSKLYGIWSDEQKHEVPDNRCTSPTFKIVMNKNP